MERKHLTVQEVITTIGNEVVNLRDGALKDNENVLNPIRFIENKQTIEISNIIINLCYKLQLELDQEISDEQEPVEGHELKDEINIER